ncbi:protein ECERIFERUM 26-like [Salvia miltiorrhiza]|uniref:protein ECERIFERUM 26-like n=1 Tax=Salvia miltiorrhiza TaxID=226208 RepID=UPI0025AB6776|nr:protein ECERIFERUM 26-like [Salvia miltiorrhiza]
MKKKMVSSPTSEGLIYDTKLSSVGPAYATEPELVFEPSNLDLAMKLHYLRGIYYFERQAFEGLSILAIKEPMFEWLNKYPVTSGRFRRAESGRAYIKCNDCGVRFVEAKCEKSLDEWLEMRDASLEKLLVNNQNIGPELGFSPLIFIQLTKFKCGGVAMGLSWAHVLGDAFSAAEFLNMLGRVVAGQDLGRPFDLAQTLTKSNICNDPPKVADDPTAVKRVEPVGDNWLTPTKSKLEDFSFDVTPTQLGHLQSKLGPKFGPFETISTIIWKCIAKMRGQDSEPNVVTICKKSEVENKIYGMLGNTQVVSVVKADFPVVDAEPSVVASLMKDEAFDMREKINEAMERENGVVDYVIYGANLTFVNLEEAKFYDFEYRGHKPVRVSYRVDGVGDQGAVLVLPGPDGGRVVVAILPEEEIVGLKEELKREGLIA